MKRIFVLLLTLVLTVLMCSSVSAEKDRECEYARIIDDAGVLSDSEVEKLMEKLDKVSIKHTVDFVIITVENTENYGIDWYIGALYDELGFGFGETKDGVILMIDMEERKYRIMANGLADDAISYDNIDSISVAIEPELLDGDYYGAFNTFVEKSEYYVNGYINGFPFKFTQNLLICIGIGIVVALISTLVMRSGLKSVREQRTANQYTRRGSMAVRIQNDLYLYSNVTRVRIQTSSNGRSGGGGGRKSGGGRF